MPNKKSSKATATKSVSGSPDDLRFVVAIRSTPKNMLFGFPTKKARDEFVQDIVAEDADIEYIIGEIEPGAAQSRNPSKKSKNRG
jgi:hypothetical protein